MDSSFFRAAIDAMSEGVCFADARGNIIFWSKSAERISGYSSNEIIGKNCGDNILIHLDEDGAVYRPSSLIYASMCDGKIHREEMYLHHKYGHRVSVTARSSPVRNKAGELVGVVEVFTGNTSKLNILKELEVLRQDVLTDELTCIGNRRYAETMMENMDKSLAKYNVPFGVLFVDIDHFKKVNDKWGHAVGDRVLYMVAQTLDNGLRGLDIACRWGGEEFVLLIPNINKEPLLALGNRLRVLIENSWLDHEGQRISVTASFGGAISQRGEPAMGVVHRADMQAYLSKQAGRNCVHLDEEFNQ